MPVRLRAESSPRSFLERLSSELRKPISDINAIHMKGFGPKFTDEDAPFPSSALDLLLQADLVVFDGDDYSENNYTRSLRDYLLQKGSKARLLAFKFEDEVEKHFIPTWSKCTLPLNEMLDLSYIAASRSDVMASTRFFDLKAAETFMASFLTAECEPRIQEDFSKLLTQDQTSYVALGTWAVTEMKDAGANVSVVCFGGSIVVGCEALLHSVLFPFKGKLVQWKYFHARRRNPRNGDVQEGVLLTVKHPMITHMLADDK